MYLTLYPLPLEGRGRAAKFEAGSIVADVADVADFVAGSIAADVAGGMSQRLKPRLEALRGAKSACADWGTAK